MLLSFTRRDALVAGLAVLTVSAFAQSYPDRPVRLVVPFPPGNTSDLLARMVAEAINRHTGASVVVENRPGASGSVGVQSVVSAEPDGYTLLVTTQSPIVLNPNLLSDLLHDPTTDFSPVALFGRTGSALVVAQDFPAETVEEIVEALRAAPEGHYSGATPGVGTMSHLAMELLNLHLGMQVEPIPYAGSAAALTDLGQNCVQFRINSFNSAIAHAEAANRARSRSLRRNEPPRFPTCRRPLKATCRNCAKSTCNPGPDCSVPPICRLR